MSKAKKRRSSSPGATRSKAVPFSGFDMAELEKGLKEAKERRDREERNRYAPTEKTVGKCSSCKGDIVLKTRWELAVPSSKVFSAVKSFMRQVQTCFCSMCGSKYEPGFFEK